MKILLHFDVNGRPSLGIVTGAEPGELDFTDFHHFPMLVLSEGVEIEYA